MRINASHLFINSACHNLFAAKMMLTEIMSRCSNSAKSMNCIDEDIGWQEEGRQQLKFPNRLYLLLEDASRKGFESIISWTPCGTAFKVHNHYCFESKIMPMYFPTMSNYKSFRRQLNLYGISQHRDKKSTKKVKKEAISKDGTYSHDLLQRGCEHLCKIHSRKSRQHQSSKKSGLKQSRTPVSTTVSPDLTSSFVGLAECDGHAPTQETQREGKDEEEASRRRTGKRDLAQIASNEMHGSGNRARANAGLPQVTADRAVPICSAGDPISKTCSSSDNSASRDKLQLLGDRGAGEKPAGSLCHSSKKRPRTKVPLQESLKTKSSPILRLKGGKKPNTKQQPEHASRNCLYWPGEVASAVPILEPRTIEQLCGSLEAAPPKQRHFVASNGRMVDSHFDGIATELSSPLDQEAWTAIDRSNDPELPRFSFNMILAANCGPTATIYGNAQADIDEEIIATFRPS